MSSCSRVLTYYSWAIPAWEILALWNFGPRGCCQIQHFYTYYMLSTNGASNCETNPRALCRLASCMLQHTNNECKICAVTPTNERNVANFNWKQTYTYCDCMIYLFALLLHAFLCLMNTYYCFCFRCCCCCCCIMILENFRNKWANDSDATRFSQPQNNGMTGQQCENDWAEIARFAVHAFRTTKRARTCPVQIWKYFVHSVLRSFSLSLMHFIFWRSSHQ